MPKENSGGKTVRIGLVQMAMGRDRDSNVSKAIRLVRQAAKKGANIICLPELFSSPYFPQAENDKRAFGLAETIPGQTTREMSRLAKELGVVLIVPIYEKSSGKFFNAIAVIDETGKLLGKYRKMHLPNDPLFYEHNYFSHGDMGYKVFGTKYGRIAPLICFDQWFPEAARISTLQGADIIFYPTAIGWIRRYPAPDNWLDAWTTIQRAHSIANGVHIAAVNRVGVEGELAFWGSSFITDSFGKILKKGGAKEEVIISDIDLGNNRRIKDGWGFLRNRRPDSYEELWHEAHLKSSALTPARLGYEFPAEWEKHDSVFLSWPHDRVSFSQMEKAERAYIQILRALEETGSEKVNLFVTGKKIKTGIGKILSEEGLDFKRINFCIHDYADVWFRDYGPTFVVNRAKKKLAMVKWKFNAWGAKYKALMKDDRFPELMNREMKLPYFDSGIVMEGGSIDGNGKGCLLTTEQCLLSPKRNPRHGKEDIEQILCAHLGVKKIIWLGKGVAGDDTDGHVDNLARFVNPGTILCAFEEGKKDENYTNLKGNYDSLLRARDQDGRPFKIVKLPVPHFYYKRHRYPASYTNFYIANNAVLVPQFNLSSDSKALQTIRRFFPGRKTIGIDCSGIILGMGSVHCISQQQPRP